jgi:hypothetical protein
MQLATVNRGVAPWRMRTRRKCPYTDCNGTIPVGEAHFCPCCGRPVFRGRRRGETPSPNEYYQVHVQAAMERRARTLAEIAAGERGMLDAYAGKNGS